jgi:putative ABC transport system permease protein
VSTIFGILADILLVTVMVIFGVCLAAGAWILIRHRAVFRIGIRNIPRRPAQAILIIIGLMLSTTVIAAV